MKGLAIPLFTAVALVLVGCGDDSSTDPDRFAPQVVQNKDTSLGYFKNKLPNDKTLECVYGRRVGSISCNWEAYNEG